MVLLFLLACGADEAANRPKRVEDTAAPCGAHATVLHEQDVAWYWDLESEQLEHLLVCDPRGGAPCLRPEGVLESTGFLDRVSDLPTRYSDAYQWVEVEVYEVHCGPFEWGGRSCCYDVSVGITVGH